MGCAPSKAVVAEPLPADADDFPVTPASIANCSVEGIFYGEYTREVYDQPRTRRFTFADSEKVTILADDSAKRRYLEATIELTDRLSLAQDDQVILRSFSSWRIMTLKAKDNLTTNLVSLAKQLPELTRLALPQVSGM